MKMGYVNLYKYTYLNANGYLQKFRDALGIPNLDRATLTKLLKVLNKDLKLVRFIVPDDRGNLALYYKDTLNKILGIDATGIEYMKPEKNPYLKKLHEYINNWSKKDDAEEDFYADDKVKEEDPFNGDTDMARVSQKLIDYQNFNENKAVKRIFVTEAQLNQILESGIQVTKYSVEPEKVKIVSKFLDDNFIKAGMPTIGEDGYPKTLPIVAMKGTDGNPVRNMSDKQVFELLKDKFAKIYSDTKRTERFLAQVLKDWYYGKTSKQGMLSVNSY